MKAYIKPEIEIRVFETEDIVTTSNMGGDSPEYKILKTSVNGNEGIDYGAQEVSVFDE